jgi:nitrate reductase beta subunit
MILDFKKPKKIRSTKEHNRMYSSYSGIAGTYVQNMSKEDMNKWKATWIKGDKERIEIRKTLGSQLLIVVYKNSYNPKYPDLQGGEYEKYKSEMINWCKKHNDIQISMNGKLDITFDEYKELLQAIEEAKQLLITR